MKKRIALIMATVVLALGCLAMATGCSGKQVAATVNGVDIYEETITEDVKAFRASYGLEDDDMWAQWMAVYGYTPETVRQSMIDSYVQTEVVKAAAKENGVTVDSKVVDEYVEQIKSSFDSDAAFQEALKGAGYDEKSYRERLEEALLEQELMDKVAPLTAPDDETLLTYANLYVTYYNGAKRSSHILISDEATAQDVLNKINSGELSFEDAVSQYSEDPGSKDNGGDVGWDFASNFVVEYTTALGELEAGQLSGLVKSDFGYHIIKCTEVFNAPAELTSTDQLPASILELVSKVASESLQQTNFDNWLKQYKETLTITVKDMPSGLPYDVDMSSYTNLSANGAGVTVVDPETSNTETENTASQE